MKGKFIYVFSEDDKKKLLEGGYKFINKILVGNNYAFIFENKGELVFSKDEEKRFLFSNTLMI